MASAVLTDEADGKTRFPTLRRLAASPSLVERLHVVVLPFDLKVPMDHMRPAFWRESVFVLCGASASKKTLPLTTIFRPHAPLESETLEVCLQSRPGACI